MIQSPTDLQPDGVVNSITVDVEDYFHTEAMAGTVKREDWDRFPCYVERNTRLIFELFSKYRVNGTFFFLGWVAHRFPSLLREAVALGHEVACHSYWHRLVYRLTPAQFRDDTERAKKVIEDATGQPVLGYRAPSFSFTKGTEWAADILLDLDFAYDSSVCPVRHDIYNNADAPRTPFRIAGGRMMEFPVATMSIRGHNFPVGGGGNLRLLPYSFTRWALTRLNGREKMRSVLYIHPWELDPKQPRLSARPRSKLRQYTGLTTTAWKLERMLREFRFAPIAKVFERELSATTIYQTESAHD